MKFKSELRLRQYLCLNDLAFTIVPHLKPFLSFLGSFFACSWPHTLRSSNINCSNGFNFKPPLRASYQQDELVLNRLLSCQSFTDTAPRLPVFKHGTIGRSFDRYSLALRDAQDASLRCNVLPAQTQKTHIGDKP